MSGGKSQHGYVAAPEHDAAVSAGSDVKKLSHAHVVFRKKRSCEAALACNCAIQPAHIDETEEEGAESGVSVSGGGVRAWAREWRDRRVTEDELQASVDAYMTYFDERTEAEKAARKNRVVDEDGFELVTYKRKSYASETPAEPRKKKKTLALDNFYRFQIRDKKREELAVLRNKFEASLASLQPLMPLLHTCVGALLCVAALSQHDCHLPAMRCIRYRRYRVAQSARRSPLSGQCQSVGRKPNR